MSHGLHAARCWVSLANKLTNHQTLTSQSSKIDKDEMQPPPHDRVEQYTRHNEIVFHAYSSSQLPSPDCIYWMKSAHRNANLAYAASV